MLKSIKVIGLQRCNQLYQQQQIHPDVLAHSSDVIALSVTRSIWTTAALCFARRLIGLAAQGIGSIGIRSDSVGRSPLLTAESRSPGEPGRSCLHTRDWDQNATRSAHP